MTQKYPPEVYDALARALRNEPLIRAVSHRFKLQGQLRGCKDEVRSKWLLYEIEKTHNTVKQIVEAL